MCDPCVTKLVTHTTGWVIARSSARGREINHLASRPVSTEAATEQTQAHGGRLIAQRLKGAGVSRLFTLSGGHLFSIFDGCRAEGIELVDVRHESTAGFAAEGWAKVTRQPGVAALTAGPGVTNDVSP